MDLDLPRETEQVFLKTLESRKPPAFILGNGTSHTLGFVRSLGRRAIPVVALSAEPGPRVRSRYCLIDRVIEDEDALLTFLTGIGSRMPGKGVMIATGDTDVLFLSRKRARLGQYFHFVLPEPPILERLANKKSQYEYASSIGIPVPRTYFPKSQDELRQIAEVVGYPCLIKPAYSHLWLAYRRQVSMAGWQKAAHIETPQDLHTAFRRMSEGGVELLIQERIGGGDALLYSVYTYLDRHSQPLAAFVMQKRRQWPPVYGNGSYSVSCRQEEVAALSLKLLRHAAYQGVSNVEFKHDPKDGAFKLIEVNVRCGNRIALAVASGADIPYLMYRDILGESVPAVDSYRTGVTWVDLGSDFKAFLHCRKTDRLSLWRWGSSVLCANSHSYLAYDDPLPFLARLCKAAKSILFSLHRRLGMLFRVPAGF